MGAPPPGPRRFDTCGGASRAEAAEGCEGAMGGAVEVEGGGCGGSGKGVEGESDPVAPLAASRKSQSVKLESREPTTCESPICLDKTNKGAYLYLSQSLGKDWFW
jgi:hypothetical protein